MPVHFSGVRVFDGRSLLAGARDVLVERDRVVAVEHSLTPPETAERVQGGFLMPGFVDAHVHLSLSDPSEVAAGGVTTVLDLGEPPEYAFGPHPPLTFRCSGPIITAQGGYPTRSWGKDGYGVGVDGPADAQDVVARLADRGASVIKVAIEPRGGPILDTETLRAVVTAAEVRGLRVAAHAVEAPAVEAAVSAGVGILAHTPTGKLSDTLITGAGARGVVVISTLRAFGAGRHARRNLTELAAAGCSVAYGTDLGNGSIKPGIDIEELQLIAEALGAVEAALVSATSSGGEIAGYGGRISAGGRADLVWLAGFGGLGDLTEKRVWIGGTPSGGK